MWNSIVCFFKGHADEVKLRDYTWTTCLVHYKCTRCGRSILVAEEKKEVK